MTINEASTPAKTMLQLRNELERAERIHKNLNSLVAANEQIGRILLEQRTEAQKKVNAVKNEVLDFARNLQDV